MHHVPDNAFSSLQFAVSRTADHGANAGSTGIVRIVSGRKADELTGAELDLFYIATGPVSGSIRPCKLGDQAA